MVGLAGDSEVIQEASLRMDAEVSSFSTPYAIFGTDSENYIEAFDDLANLYPLFPHVIGINNMMINNIPTPCVYDLNFPERFETLDPSSFVRHLVKIH